MEYLEVKNWERYQHYSKRRPPWIKLYWSLLSEPNFLPISDASKLHTIAIMLLASQHDNKVPFNKTWISRAIHANTKLNWQEILSTGLILCKQDASTELASCTHVASPRARSRETETETETETDTKDTETDSAKPEIAGSNFQQSGTLVALTLPLADTSEWNLTEDRLTEFIPLYPGTDVRAECLKAKAWLIANPTRRKTRSGMMRFLNNWLSRAQNNNRSTPAQEKTLHEQLFGHPDPGRG